MEKQEGWKASRSPTLRTAWKNLPAGQGQGCAFAVCLHGWNLFLCPSSFREQGAWPGCAVLWGRDTPSHTLPVLGEHRAQRSAPSVQSQRSEMGQGRWLVAPRQRTWPGIVYMAGADQVTRHPEMRR